MKGQASGKRWWSLTVLFSGRGGQVSSEFVNRRFILLKNQSMDAGFSDGLVEATVKPPCRDNPTTQPRQDCRC